MSIVLKELLEKDLSKVKQIYDHYIHSSTATFHTDPVSIEELKSIIPLGHNRYRAYLIESDGEFCGYCYFSYFKKREAYDRSAEVTIYLKPGFTGKGIGENTLKMLEKEAEKSGISVLIGIVTSENTLSTGLLEKCGYEKCAHYKKVGEKFGRVLDVVSYQKIINE